MSKIKLLNLRIFAMLVLCIKKWKIKYEERALRIWWNLIQEAGMSGNVSRFSNFGN